MLSIILAMIAGALIMFVGVLTGSAICHAWYKHNVESCKTEDVYKAN